MQHKGEEDIVKGTEEIPLGRQATSDWLIHLNVPSQLTPKLNRSTQLTYFEILYFFIYSKMKYFISQIPCCDVISLNHWIIRFI